ncbi:probable 2-oxoglutarate dehydrogenase E1 component DHKTD1 homolog, mitochondrial isoform X2 [Maniola jurtina]|uniref:probable 2-oxoglutarate dehydrogenase E1 component DHKTD1 homolog, mitochondrial isoform X2 n=1 Tax=Maniola jurtina TaxID=191418 RepID=UPI001E68E9DF|nr:probable 2-oxoglutarate dehydrogenase E1 component DHKTD1 homolog, mitochondrial isoform X2 [Maniola jurtina]
MIGFSKVRVKQVTKWKEYLKYHSGVGVFGHRPRESIEFDVPEEVLSKRFENCRAQQLVNAYRTYGHLRANIDNVDYRKETRSIKELDLSRYGLSGGDVVDSGLLYGHNGKQTANNLREKLEGIYCGPISYEFSYLEIEAEREWFAQRVEGGIDTIDGERRIEILKELLHSQAWDKFLSIKYPTVKRYCGEGAESLLTFFSTLFRLTTSELKHVVIAMAHRGKLNVLSGLLQCPPVKIFHKFNGNPEFPAEANSACDIATHLSASTDISMNGNTVKFSLINNPSHLEAANPVSMGKTRSKQLKLMEGDYSRDEMSRFGDKVLNVQIHGDAAFTGQGVNQETLMLSQVPHFEVGGSLHVVVNNQVGFTLPANRGRSSRYVTDLAKSIAVPVIHVNGDHPELIVKATNIAFEYQRKFRKDVFIDYNCYRRWGHNELDDPTFTNPLLYKLIHNRKSIPDLYADKLISEALITEKDLASINAEYTKFLQEQFEAATTYTPQVTYYQEQWSGMSAAPAAVEVWDTGVDKEMLKLIGRASVTTPSDFVIHAHLAKTHVKNRLNKINEENVIDWATAEAMAIGSLLMEGRHVRLSGEDVGRGTFSHRHLMLIDQEKETIHVPLNHIHEEQKGFLEVANSILSEEAVLGYEYGMAFDSPDNLYIWEAQFGDFYTGAQIIVDTFIASGESKWVRSNGLVMLLPHGFDGAASEHSSCRMERFLQLTDSSETKPDSEAVCMHVANPTTPAQYFHLLRRQMVRNYRKPLVVVAPKILLRLADATSPLSDFAPGTHFKPVIGDTIADPLRVNRVILVCGKHYYELHKERLKARIDDVAIIRVESLSPFPLHALQQEVGKYKNARKFIWSQEEHRNMGAWTFVKPRFENLLGKKLLYAGRAEAATTAVGASKLHRVEVEHILREPLYNIK